MRHLTCLLLYTQAISVWTAVPPAPLDRLWKELDSTKIVMTSIAMQLEKFNSLYLMKLEQKIISAASTLANIDSNIKNLQERAHVWDTFQLHVSAWNEQIKTLDKKVDIISRAQEKIMNLDGKVNSVINIDYKIERMFEKLDDSVSLLQNVAKLVENQHDPLFGEFTSRGVLSTLKIIERKLDKLQMQYSSSQSMIAKQIIDNRRKSESDLEQKGKLLIKCNTPPKVEELLSDVSSKIDVIFDKFSNSEETADYNNPEEQKDSSEITSQESKNDSDLKLIRNLLKRLNQPCKRTIKVLENLESSISVIDNRTLTLLGNGKTLQNAVLNLYNTNNQTIERLFVQTNDIVNKTQAIIYNMTDTFKNEEETIANHFYLQREHFTNVLQNALQQYVVASKKDSHTIVSFGEEDRYENVYPTTAETPTYLTSTFTDKTACEELETSEDGIFVLAGSEEINSSGRKYNTRYCEQRDNYFWTVIQRRGINPNFQSFNLSWEEYKNGFGQLDKDFWFGNDFIHLLTKEKDIILRVELEDFEGRMAWAEFYLFKVLSEKDKYKLLIGGYRGNASDSFSAHNNSYFSTYDRTNDNAPVCCPCAPSYGGGWWFYSCFEANLNGIYSSTPTSNEYFKGLIWEYWLGNYSLKKTKMMLRPKATVEVDNGSGTDTYIEDPFDIPEDP